MKKENKILKEKMDRLIGLILICDFMRWNQIKWKVGNLTCKEYDNSIYL